MQPQKKRLDFNIGPIKVKFRNEFQRIFEIKESEDSKFNVLEIGYLEYNDICVVLAVKEDTEDETVIPFIAETKKDDEYIIMFDYECYMKINDQKYRCYIAHELGHIVSEIKGKKFPLQSYEDKEQEALANIVNQNEHSADLEALGLLRNKNTYINSLNYLIDRFNEIVPNNSDEIKKKNIYIQTMKLRISALN
ncbi:MAG: hypothetical protein A2Y45_03870 [Tenericutes bacterium GWC2_34_14]|nr:MAG: hypothetical protein A2Z84_05160 [Tenericutes bacterium GWA2_35_7]OHE28884.1 MAG: hypothetical protein A2Y45_03870 [Tenericutes bacterium GWC2_34_14]OHE33778.1 MAG: hypothetical protein A2012_07265 [Tenericutes bacterium GWE2_34_108]OHE36347.1 MAG: hypothetical protein A2Y46_00115 [Tenericutes bacterium GWF1_35_14]OHE37731.1 MAG: hypothetical protein A2Y44_00070 [Tenericutes bacterium GWF2_35_184]OHE41868.1 MAG: hypothetical protein A3K26_07750 [Tenericutes bacterium RIFOXYA12_FULL_35_